MKKIKTSLCLLALSVSTAHAGGFENARLDTSFMYDEGNLYPLVQCGRTLLSTVVPLAQLNR